ncbi:MAG: enoyl-CoA hydratase/isomerase family protein [Hyphomicrobiales bacterium]|nr:enoyl-CoA hydratase/isomerase family protein [Hyphomicrobiales bacterium]
MSPDVIISQNEGVLELRLDRPFKKNAVTIAMYAAMADALQAAEHDDAVRAIVFTADGDMFTSGNDLADFAQAASSGSMAALADIVRFLHVLAGMEKPVVAAVGGDGVGIGATLLLHSDIVIIAENAKLVTPFTGLGLTPEGCSSLLLPKLIGDKRAFMMLALGEPLGAKDAVDFGFATKLTSADQVDAEARDAARRCAKVPPEAMHITKRLLRDKEAIRKAIDTELHYFQQRLASPEARAAFAAFFSR